MFYNVSIRPIQMFADTRVMRTCIVLGRSWQQASIVLAIVEPRQRRNMETMTVKRTVAFAVVSEELREVLASNPHINWG